jgi:hypothetical protein
VKGREAVFSPWNRRALPPPRRVFFPDPKRGKFMAFSAFGKFFAEGRLFTGLV